VGTEEPSLHTEPAGQTVQVGFATLDENLPAGQMEQVSAPTDENFPAPQAFLSMASNVAGFSPGHAWPAQHGSHDEAELLL
jgi:hypothetical protein